MTPRCRLCGSPLQPGSDFTRHIIPETCIRALADRLGEVERQIANLKAGREPFGERP